MWIVLGIPLAGNYASRGWDSWESRQRPRDGIIVMNLIHKEDQDKNVLETWLLLHTACFLWNTPNPFCQPVVGARVRLSFPVTRILGPFSVNLNT